MKRLAWDDIAILFALGTIGLALFMIAQWVGVLFVGIAVLALAVILGTAAARTERS